MDKLDRIVDKLTEISVAVAEIRKDIGRNTDDLAEHIRRTELLEAQVSDQNIRINKALTPLLWVKGAVAVCGALTVVIGFIAAVRSLT